MTEDDFEARLREAMRLRAGGAPQPGLVEQRVLAATHGQPARKARPPWFLPVVNVAVVAVVIAAVVGGVLLVRGTTTKHSQLPPAVPVSTAPPPSTPTTAVPSTPSAPSSAVAPAGPVGGPVPAGFVPYSDTWISASDGWVLGTAPCSKAPCTSVVRTRDGGKTWVGIPAPVANLANTTSNPPQVTAIRFADSLNGWAWGTQLYATHDGGASWVKQALGGTAGGPGVDALETSGGQVWAVLNNCSAAQPGACVDSVTVYRSPIGTDAWKSITAAIPTTVSGGTFKASLTVNGNDWWLSVGVVWHGIGGNAPIAALAPCASAPGTFVAAFAVADAQHLDALCTGQGAAGSSGQQLVGSVDGGRTWKPSGPSYLGPSAVAGISDNSHGVLLVAAYSGGSTVTRTTNDGQSFATVLTDPAGGGTPWTDLGFTTQQQASVVLVGRALYVSHDAGATWTAVKF